MRRISFVLVACLLASPTFAATLLVLNKEDSTLAFVDPVTGATRHTVPTGAGPHEVEVTADGGTAVVSNYGGQDAGSSLSLIDVAAARERLRAPLGDLLRPHGLAVADGHAYFTAEDARHIGRIGLADGKVDWRFPTTQQRTHMVLASQDGRTLYATNMGSGTVSVIEPAGDGAAMQTLVPVGTMPEGLALSPDGRELWVASSDAGSVAVIDVRQKKVVRSFDIGTRRANRVKFTPDGALVLVSDLTQGELVIIDARTHAVRKRLPIGRGASGILVLPDGSRAYVAAANERRLAVVDLQSLNVTGHVATGAGPDGMAWVP
ncbi:MAG: cytochrome D1 domain-containing protein [Steroidobacteraceae bacterium]